MFILRFNEFFYKYNIREIEDYDYINFTVLSKGTVLRIHEDGQLELFFSKYNIHNEFTINEIDDPAITTDMMLCNDGDEARFYRGSELYQGRLGRCE